MFTQFFLIQGNQECTALLDRAERKQRKLQREIGMVLDAIAERRARRYQYIAERDNVKPMDVASQEQDRLERYSRTIAAPGLDAPLQPREVRNRARQRWGYGRPWDADVPRSPEFYPSPTHDDPHANGNKSVQPSPERESEYDQQPHERQFAGKHPPKYDYEDEERSPARRGSRESTNYLSPSRTSPSRMSTSAEP